MGGVFLLRGLLDLPDLLLVILTQLLDLPVQLPDFLRRLFELVLLLLHGIRFVFVTLSAQSSDLFTVIFLDFHFVP
ncbi:hypothetical protein [Paenibacillus sp. N3.4]|uniref:hypothetical protein n=1 Tax=Paenibacillus sp. N3.4 TaxID=2603222 RepID=UPI001C9C8D73|nr:hypothetical protein [Paenibacillus sp. N3.4]